MSKPFPVPVRLVGPGSQVEDETLEYLALPQGMSTYAAPRLPEGASFAGRAAARAVLGAVQEALAQFAAGRRPAGETVRVDLRHLGSADRELVDQVLGEGEVAARIVAEPPIRIQESIFAGVWRVVAGEGGRTSGDVVEIGAVPRIVVDAARQVTAAAAPAGLPAGVMNAPAVMSEIDSHAQQHRPGDAAHVVNLSLLPLSEEDRAAIDAALGAGRVDILSRGYGNCRIASTGRPSCWHVVYFNSQDTVILDTIEIVDVPEAACAALEDLQDSCERLEDVLKWLHEDRG